MPELTDGDSEKPRPIGATRNLSATLIGIGADSPDGSRPDPACPSPPRHVGDVSGTSSGQGTPTCRGDTYIGRAEKSKATHGKATWLKTAPIPPQNLGRGNIVPTPTRRGAGRTGNNLLWGALQSAMGAGYHTAFQIIQQATIHRTAASTLRTLVSSNRRDTREPT